MNSWKKIWEQLQIRQFLTILFAGLLLIVVTACSGGNLQGANPQNPAVQAGGANNPYKGEGDKYTQYRMSTDPKVINNQDKKPGEQASLQPSSQIFIANKESELLYPGAETPAGRIEKQKRERIITKEDVAQPEPGGLIQREPDLGTRFQERIETVKEAVEDASSFLKEKANEANARPEIQKDPSVGK